MQPRSSAYDKLLNSAPVFSKSHARRFGLECARSRLPVPWNTRRAVPGPRACPSLQFSPRELAQRLGMAGPRGPAFPAEGSWSVILVLYSPVIVRIALELRTSAELRLKLGASMKR